MRETVKKKKRVEKYKNEKKYQNDKCQAMVRVVVQWTAAYTLHIFRAAPSEEVIGQ